MPTGDETGASAAADRGEPAESAASVVHNLRLEPGRIIADVTLQGEGDPSRVVILPPKMGGALRRRACELMVTQNGWREPFDSGCPPNHERLARGVARTLRRPYPDWAGMTTTCTCTGRRGRCAHAEVAIGAAKAAIGKSHLERLKLHGFDFRRWAESREALDAAVEPRSLRACWTTRGATWERVPLGKPPDLSAVPHMLDDILRLLAPAPGGRRTIEALRHGMLLAAERAEEFAEEEPHKGRAAREERALDVVIAADCRLRSLAWGAEPARRRGASWRGMAEREESLVGHLAFTRPERRRSVPDTDRFWGMLFRHVLELARRCAVVPEQLCGRDGHEHLIVWRPATMLSPKLRAAHDWFVRSCPPDLVRMQAPSSRSRTYRASAETQVRHAVDVLYRGLLLPAVRNEHSARGAKSDPDPFVTAYLFRWKDGPCYWRVFRKDAEACQAWLRRLSIPDRHPKAVLRISADPLDHGQVEIGLGYLDSDGRDASLADILGREATPWFLLALKEASKVVGKDVTVPGGEEAFGMRIPLTELPAFLEGEAPMLERSGAVVKLADEFREAVVPRVGYRMTHTGGAPARRFDLSELMGFDWAVALGDRHISMEEFRGLVGQAKKELREARRTADNASVYLRTDGGYIRLNPGLLRLRHDPGTEPPRMSHFELLRAALSGRHRGSSVFLDRSASRLIGDILSPRERPEPPGDLGDRLRPYQVKGFEWLAQNADVGFGSILADDMGLGKTVQAIALALHRTLRDPSHKTLVIAPPALLTNWLREIRRFAPPLRAQIYHGNARTLTVDSHDVVLSSYGIARRDAEALGARRWGLMVVDEAQNIKNPATKQSQAIKGYQAEAHVALTGTPVENHLGDYWSVFDYTNRGYLGSLKGFRDELARPIEERRDEMALERFRKLTGPFVLRRLKSDRSIAGDLPAKIEGVRYCSLTPKQAALYQATVESIMGEIQGAGDEADPRNMRRRGLIFKLLTALKQICNSPAHHLGHGSAAPAESGKLSLCLETLAELEDTGEKALVFTQYVEMGRLLVDAVRAETGEEPLFLHGSLTRKRRDEIVDAFQGDPSMRNMVLSLKTGGTGLNLTAATQVIHYDRWWNPAVERQATDRAHRIGQVGTVQVHLLVTENTLEEKIDEMLKRKRELAELTVQSGEKWLTEMTNRQLRDLVGLSKPLA